MGGTRNDKVKSSRNVIPSAARDLSGCWRPRSLAALGMTYSGNRRHQVLALMQLGGTPILREDPSAFHPRCCDTFDEALLGEEEEDDDRDHHDGGDGHD